MTRMIASIVSIFLKMDFMIQVAQKPTLKRGICDT